jgi:hypothetical protein
MQFTQGSGVDHTGAFSHCPSSPMTDCANWLSKLLQKKVTKTFSGSPEIEKLVSKA